MATLQECVRLEGKAQAILERCIDRYVDVWALCAAKRAMLKCLLECGFSRDTRVNWYTQTPVPISQLGEQMRMAIRESQEVAEAYKSMKLMKALKEIPEGVVSVVETATGSHHVLLHVCRLRDLVIKNASANTRPSAAGETV